MTMANPTINIPSAFSRLLEPWRIKAMYGGRGGAKSWAVSDLLLILGMQNKLKILCGREYQTSITDSVKSLLDRRIEAHGLDGFYESLQTEIRGANGTQFIFHGFAHKPEKIKSLDDVDICWVEEASSLSQTSLNYLIPTIRNEGSEIWFTYNRKDEHEPVHDEVMSRKGVDALVLNVNHDDNPYFPEVLRLEMLRDKERDPARHAHIWEGEPWTNSEAQVF